MVNGALHLSLPFCLFNGNDPFKGRRHFQTLLQVCLVRVWWGGRCGHFDRQPKTSVFLTGDTHTYTVAVKLGSANSSLVSSPNRYGLYRYLLPCLCIQSQSGQSSRRGIVCWMLLQKTRYYDMMPSRTYSQPAGICHTTGFTAAHTVCSMSHDCSNSNNSNWMPYYCLF